MMNVLKHWDWRRTLIQSAVLSVIAIGIPLVALAFNFNPLQPVNVKGRHINLITSCCCFQVIEFEISKVSHPRLPYRAPIIF